MLKIQAVKRRNLEMMNKIYLLLTLINDYVHAGTEARLNFKFQPRKHNK